MFITSFGEQNITYKCCSNFLIHLCSLISSYLINKSKFNQIREFDIHPLSIIRRTQTSFWWEDIWKKTANKNIRDMYIGIWSDWDSTSALANEGINEENHLKNKF